MGGYRRTATSTTPQTGVDPAANITAKFSEAMKARSINTNTFYLLPGHFTAKPMAQNYAKNPPKRCYTTAGVLVACPAPVAATVSYDAGTLTATLNPTSTLVANTEYTAVVEGTEDGDYVAVKDADGTPMATDYIFYFTTGSGGSGPGGF